MDKLVRQSPDCGGDGGYDSTETVSEGDVLDYLLVSKIPHITSQATWLTMYTFKDTLSKSIIKGSSPLNKRFEIFKSP